MAFQVTVNYSKRADDYKVTFPSGKEKRYSMIQTALRVAKAHSDMNKTGLIVTSTASENDATWATMFLNGERQ